MIRIAVQRQWKVHTEKNNEKKKLSLLRTNEIRMATMIVTALVLVTSIVLAGPIDR